MKLLSRIAAENAEIYNKKLLNLRFLYILCSSPTNITKFIVFIVFRLSIVFLFLRGQADFFI